MTAGLILASGCSVSVGAGDGSTTTAPAVDSTEVPATDGAEPAPAGDEGPRTILDGWVSYEVAPGWEVVTEADGLEERRADFDRPPFVPDLDDLQTLVEIRRTDGRASIALVREPAYLDVADIEPWTDFLIDAVAGDAAELEAEDVVQAAHGPITRLRFEGIEGTLLLGTTEFDEQRLAIVAFGDADLTEDEHEELRRLAAVIELDPDIELNPMLQYHAALAFFDRAGERAVEVALAVPSDWQAVDEPDGVSYRSAAGRTTVEVYFSLAEGRTAESVLDDALAFRPDREPLLDTEDRTLGGVDMIVARHGVAGAGSGYDRASSWVLVGEADGVIIEIFLDESDPERNTLLLDRIADTIEIRTP